MTTDTTPAAIAALLDGVTPGPWFTVRSDVYPEGECDSWVTIGPQNFDAVALVVNEHIKEDDELKANAIFIAAARELVPALSAERDRLAADNDWLRTALEEISKEVFYPPGFDRDAEPTRAAKIARSAIKGETP